MTTTTTSAALASAGPVFTELERLALAGFLAGYSGPTREAYALDLRQFAAWCQIHGLRLFGVRRADITSMLVVREPHSGTSDQNEHLLAVGLLPLLQGVARATAHAGH